MWNIFEKMDVLEAVTERARMSPLLTTCLLGVCTLLLFYWSSNRNRDYWAKKGVKHVKIHPFYLSFFLGLRKTMHDTDIERSKKLGRIYGHFEMTSPALSVADPALLRDIFVKDFASFPSRRVFKTGTEIGDKMLSIVNGEDWKRIRSIVSPTFSTGKIKRVMGIFKECSNSLVSNFRKAAEKGTHVELKRLYGAFTMDVIASSAFSTKIDSHNDPDNPLVRVARTFFVFKLHWRLLCFIFLPRLTNFLEISIFEPSSLNFFSKVTLDIIEKRKNTGQKMNDFLQLLLDTAQETSKDLDEEGQDDQVTSNYGEAPNIEHQIFRNVTKKNLSMNELVAQCILFFVAGYETTASTLSFTTYHLALNEDVQDKARKEVDWVLNEHEGELTYESVQEMKYLDNVISEALRMTPPLIRLERQASEDYKFVEAGIEIPKGMMVTIPIYAMHHDPELFPDPEKFDPDRFTAEEKAKRDPCAYLPFGNGPRNCVAMRFALLEVKVCLINVLANFRIKRCAETKVPLEFLPAQGFLQPKEFNVKFEIRDQYPLKK